MPAVAVSHQSSAHRLASLPQMNHYAIGDEQNIHHQSSTMFRIKVSNENFYDKMKQSHLSKALDMCAVNL